ncbi:LuxR C-terminal-related transcriptional regulator [Abyssalbus ytuae]|uniref:LuxR C-terminal-related transcriptional regulator n=1 Tax=Abyssalbus ytuae TaxID=2926907 RepID=A0A9E6ZZA5_9FLAO|nr:LuxR C-terminal-related transcriptional regulator [Abyssalbus ytuae]UOB16611.1 LuxR C-terminal-related transcriptional regulator [Abyssalbus ytuae]
MNTKINHQFTPTQVFHRLQAGILPGDHKIEMFGIRETRKVYFSQNGEIKPLSKLPKELMDQLIEQLLSDNVALRDLKDLTTEKMLEEYAFCLYGTADSDADFTDSGDLKGSENFRCGDNCKCLRWKTKKVLINNKHLTRHKINILDAISTGLTDKEIAEKFHISESTLNTHKKELFDYFKVKSSRELISKAIKKNILQ